MILSLFASDEKDQIQERGLINKLYRIRSVKIVSAE